MSLAINIGGIYKDMDKGYVNIGGVWKQIDKIFCNIGGVLKEGYSASSEFIWILFNGANNYTEVSLINTATGATVFNTYVTLQNPSYLNTQQYGAHCLVSPYSGDLYFNDFYGRLYKVTISGIVSMPVSVSYGGSFVIDWENDLLYTTGRYLTKYVLSTGSQISQLSIVNRTIVNVAAPFLNAEKTQLFNTTNYEISEETDTLNAFYSTGTLSALSYTNVMGAASQTREFVDSSNIRYRLYSNGGAAALGKFAFSSTTASSPIESVSFHIYPQLGVFPHDDTYVYVPYVGGVERYTKSPLAAYDTIPITVEGSSANISTISVVNGFLYVSYRAVISGVTRWWFCKVDTSTKTILYNVEQSTANRSFMSGHVISRPKQ